MGQRSTTEFWREVRELVERGLSLKKASKQFGLFYSNLSQRAAIEGWKLVWRGTPRTRDYPDGTRRVEMAKEQARRDTQQAELLLEARVAVIDTKKAELVAQKILAQHSIKMKMALSELVLQTIEDLRSPEVRPKDRATAMVNLKTVCNQLYGWDGEPDLRGMKLAKTSDNASQQVSFYQALASRHDPTASHRRSQLSLNRHHPPTIGGDGPSPKKSGMARRDASATERNGLSMRPSAIAAEPPPAATHGCPIPEKEAPSLAPKQPDPSPTPAVQEQQARREAYQRASAQHRAELRQRPKLR